MLPPPANTWDIAVRIVTPIMEVAVTLTVIIIAIAITAEGVMIVIKTAIPMVVIAEIGVIAVAHLLPEVVGIRLITGGEGVTQEVRLGVAAPLVVEEGTTTVRLQPGLPLLTEAILVGKVVRASEFLCYRSGRRQEIRRVNGKGKGKGQR
jgi:hypothetical protein